MEKPSLLPVLTTSPSTSQLPEWHTVFFFCCCFLKNTAMATCATTASTHQCGCVTIILVAHEETNASSVLVP